MVKFRDSEKDIQKQIVTIMAVFALHLKSADADTFAGI